MGEVGGCIVVVGLVASHEHGAFVDVEPDFISGYPFYSNAPWVFCFRDTPDLTVISKLYPR